MSILDDAESERIEAEWGDAFRLRGRPSDVVRRGEALALLTNSLDLRSTGISRTLVSRLTREPAFQAEVDRVRALIGPVEPLPECFPRCGADEPTYSAWKDRSKRQGEVISREGRKFAAEHRFRYISPQAVESVLGQILAGSPNLVVPDAGQTIYVNPLDDTELIAPVGPRRILVDLTHASYDDLVALAPRLTAVQARLGYEKLRGRHLQDNAEQMSFVHKLRTTPTGRGRVRTWHQVAQKVNEQFGEDVSETTLKQRYAGWKRANGAGNKFPGE